MDYGNLLKRSWDIVWNNKFMFVLGFLAALGSGSGNNGGGGANSGYNFGSQDFYGEPFKQLQSFWSQYGGLIIGFICAAFILAIILWLVRLTAQTGMIEAVSLIEAGEKVTFGQAFSAGTSKLGRMVGLNVIMYGPFTLLGLIGAGIGLSFFFSAIGADFAGATSSEVESIFQGLGVFGICLACLACLMVPLLIFVTAIYPFAQRGLVIEELGAVDSIRHGWQILKDNVGDIILLIVLFIVLSIVFGFATFIVLIPVGLLALAPGIGSLIAGQGSVGPGEIVLLAGGGICIGLLAAAISSILTSFRSTAVTLAYQQFTTKKTG